MTGTTAVNMAINIIQISALLVFSVIAIAYRTKHPQGSIGYHLSNGVAVNYQVAQDTVKDDKGNPLPVLDANNKPTMDDDGKPVYQMAGPDRQGRQPGAGGQGRQGRHRSASSPRPSPSSYHDGDAYSNDPTTASRPSTSTRRPSRSSAPHSFNFVFIQACVAILILVGFESVTADGRGSQEPEEGHRPGRAALPGHPGRGLLPVRYFAANYLLHNGYTLPHGRAPARRSAT